MNKKAYNPMDNRPEFPKRAVITGGMPYGNKELHLGHIGGVFIHADTFARFMRDRIGKDNVVFVSGTDCYGSPIIEYYRKAKENGQAVPDTLEEFVLENHEKQKDVLNDYNISLNLYGTSAFGRSGEIHREVANEFLQNLYKNGGLKKLSSQQFYDESLEKVLNGRQVLGKCPIPNCNSETAYADECSLGHQYRPVDLIDPISALSNTKPSMIEVTNWYFDLEKYMEYIDKYINSNKTIRKLVKSAIAEFLKEPISFIRNEDMEIFNSISNQLPKFEIIEEKKKSSVSVKFSSLEDRDKATEVFGRNNIRFRNGKTLVPFRLTGNEEWGIPCDEIEDLKDLTFWVWPESLFAPISFTKAYLESIGKDNDEYKKYWYEEDAQVYQFIGSDNIYFYGIAEIGMFLRTQEGEISLEKKAGNLVLPNVVANNHVLFLGKKASSSSEIKPPKAKELLDHYNVFQLKSHFLAFGLGSKEVAFKPKPFNPEAKDDELDPVLVEGNLYTNVYNRLLRTFFYTLQEMDNPKLNWTNITPDIIISSNESICKFERHMYKYEFHRTIDVLDTTIRNANKYFVKELKENPDQALIDTLHMIRTITVLIHPMMPDKSELILDYLNISKSPLDFWSWNNIFKTFDFFVDDIDSHEFKTLEAKVDFFEKLESQY